MRIVFAGTPVFAATALAAILEAAPTRGWSVPLVLTQPDRPAGRGMKLAPGAVRSLALEHGIAIASPGSLRKGADAAAARDQLMLVDPDVLVVAAYGLILPAEVLALPRGLQSGGPDRLGAINIHASILPRWRGAAPVARAIEAGDTVTGITIMQMDAGLDTGPILLTETVPIASTATAGELTSELARCGAALIVRTLADAASLVPTPQPAAGVTYASKIDKAEAWLDWCMPAELLARRVRAFDPFPVATGRIGGHAIRFWRAQAEAGASVAEPGTVLAADRSGVRVACGSGSLVLTELQRAGGKRLPVHEFLAGFALLAAQRFERPTTDA
jgi:methionyl-tRNA formyltransferase